RDRTWKPDADRRATWSRVTPERCTGAFFRARLAWTAVRRLRVESTPGHLGVENISGLQRVAEPQDDDTTNRVRVPQLPLRFECGDRCATRRADMSFDDGHDAL